MNKVILTTAAAVVVALSSDWPEALEAAGRGPMPECSDIWIAVEYWRHALEEGRWKRKW